MEKENNFSVLNAFKHDKVVWGIVAAVSVILLVSSGNRLPVSMAYVCIGVACTVLMAHVPHKYFRLGTIPLAAMTIALMAVGIFIVPIDGRWLLLGSIAFNPLWFASLSVCLLLTDITIQKNDWKKLLWVLVLIVICSLCYALDMSYAMFLTTMVMFGMLLLGIYRKVVFRFVCLMIVVDIMFLGLTFLFGRTADERRDNSTTQKVELPSTFQTRIDNLKEYTVNVFASEKEDNIPAEGEMDMDKSGNTNILATSYHNIYTHTGTWGCIGITLLYILLLCRVIYRLESSNSKFAKSLMLCCSIVLVLDSAYNTCMAMSNYPYSATSAMAQYVIFGIILSCLNSCNKASTGRIKAFFKTMIEE